MSPSNNPATNPRPKSGEVHHPGSNPERFRPSGKQIGGGIALVLLIWFIAVNRDEVELSYIFGTASVSLWFAMTIAAVVGAGIGAVLTSRTSKRRSATKASKKKQ